MSKCKSEAALLGFGVCLELIDRNGRSAFFYPLHDPLRDIGNVAALSLRDLAVWLAEAGYMPDSDGSMMVLAG